MAVAMSISAQGNVNPNQSPTKEHIVATAPGQAYTYAKEARLNQRRRNIGGSNRHSGTFKILNQRQKRLQKRRFGHNRR